MAKFYLLPIAQWFLDSGIVNSGGLIQSFAAGTVTPLATYTDSTGNSANPNPVVLSSAGRAQIWLSSAAYKFVIQTAAGATIMTIDGYDPVAVNTTVTSLIDTGDLTMQQPTAANSGANQSSNNLKVQATFWDGAASQIDQWNIANILGIGSNPTSTLTVTHSGSSGASSISIPSAAVSFGGTVSIKNLENIRFADQFATGSSTGGIQEAINDLPAGGGTVRIPPNYTANCTIGITTTKNVRIVGGGWTSVISGTGITILKASLASGFSIEDVKIFDPTGNASTIGLLLDNGNTGMADWLIKNVYVLGTGKVAGSIGIKTNFALIGNIIGGRFEGWDTGMSLTGPDSSHRSNAIEIAGVDVTSNNTGISYPNGVDDAFIHSSTIEGNTTAGLSAAPAVGVMSLTLTGNHFENAAASNISLSGLGGKVTGTGNGFYAGTANQDYNITAGAWNVVNTGETINEGMTNNGTGSILRLYPQVSGTVTGTGVIMSFDGFTFKQEQPAGNNVFMLQNFAWFQPEQIFKIKELGAPGAGTANYDWFWASSANHRLMMNNNNGGNDNIVGAATTDTLQNKTLTGASSGNSIVLLNEQGPSGALTGNSGDQTIFTYTLPANVLQAGKGLHVYFWCNHNSGAVTVTYKLFFGATAYLSNGGAAATGQVFCEAMIFNNAGVVNAQHGSNFFTNESGATQPFTGVTSAIDTTASVVIKATFNVASPNQVTPGQWFVELLL